MAHPLSKFLTEDPDLTEDPAFAAVAGDVSRLAAALDADPDLANRPTRFEGWTLLMIAAGSPLLHDPGRRGGVLAAIRLLLDRGADVNGFVPQPEFPGCRLGALYAAANTSHDLEVVRLLLDAGADADDGESLFHATETDDLELLATLIEAGADVNGIGVLHHAVEREAPAVLRLLLERGGDPNRATSYFSPHPLLHHAIRNGRMAATVTLLVEQGAEIGRVDGNGRTAYAVAIRLGREDLVALFAARGYAEEPGPLERAIREGRRPSGELSADIQALLPDAAMGGNLEQVRRLLEAGWPVDARGENGATALHFAAWYGNLPMVRAILGFGPDLTLRDTEFDATPLGWANHGSAFSPSPKDDYPEIVETLRAAGAGE